MAKQGQHKNDASERERAHGNNNPKETMHGSPGDAPGRPHRKAAKERPEPEQSEDVIRSRSGGHAEPHDRNVGDHAHSS
jgi:hypothetical protein